VIIDSIKEPPQINVSREAKMSVSVSQLLIPKQSKAGPWYTTSSVLVLHPQLSSLFVQVQDISLFFKIIKL